MFFDPVCNLPDKDQTMNADHQHHVSQAPIVTSLQVIPVAGHDSMLLNLSGAHGPFFTRNIVILKDSSMLSWPATGITCRLVTIGAWLAWC